MKLKRAISFLLAVVLSVGMMSMICLPAVAAANPVFIINPNGTDGSTATQNGVTGTVYTSYDAFEEANPDVTAADVHFVSGHHYGDFTVTKKVNLYGPKKGIDPNVKGSDILQGWTLNGNRNGGEAVLHGKVEIATEGAGNDVLMDGLTIGQEGQIHISCSKQDLTVTIQNIVIATNANPGDYCILAAPDEAKIPGYSAYKLTFHLKNVYSDTYSGTGSFISYIAAKETVLDNVFFKDSTAMFLNTTAASTAGCTYVMRNSFLFRNRPASDKKATIIHDYPSNPVTPSVTYENNVFYNAHPYGGSGYTIFCDRLNNAADTRIFTGNTFVSEYGYIAPIRLVDRSFAANADNYDLSNMVVKENRIVGYAYAVDHTDSRYQGSSGIKTYVGTLDLSDNFTYLVDSVNTTETKVLSILRVDQCLPLTGVQPVTIGNGIVADTSGPYYTNFDKTISTDMLRVTGVDLDSAQINIADKKIKGILPEDDYVPTFTFTCGNDIPRTVTIKNASGTTVSSINAAGTYQVTVGYESQTPVTFELEVEKATAYTGEGYVFDPNATKNTAYYWGGAPQMFTYGTNLFSDLTALFAKADADGVAVPQVLLPPITIAGDYTITHSCEVLGYHHDVNPVVSVNDPTKENTLSTKRGVNESIITGKWTFEYVANNMTFAFDGITLKGDGRFEDVGNGMLGETVSFDNIICSAGMFSSAAGVNARFGTKAYSEKTLRFYGIYADGVKLNSANTGDSQLLYLTASTVLVDNIYIANTDLLLCANIFLQSGTNYTRYLVMTIRNSKFYNATAARWLKLNGEESGSYRKFANRSSVTINVQNNMFYNCADSDNSNPNGNAVLVFNYSYPCFNYTITGNSFVEDREVYHFLEDENPDKNIGTDVYNQFIHFVPQNHGEGGANNNSNLGNNFTIEGNRFIGRNTVINSENDLFNGSIELENNFFVSYETVQKSKSSTNWVTKLKGENPNKVMNVRNTKDGVQAYYLDYAMQSSTAIMGAEESFARVDRVNHIMELTQTSGKILAANLRQTADLAKAAMYEDAACTQVLSSGIDCDSLSKGTHIFYVKYTDRATEKTTVVYTLVLHTDETDLTYSREAVLYDPLAKGLPAGIKWYREMNGVLYAFETGKTVFGDMDDIVIHTQETKAEVLLPAGDYTSEQLSTVESVNYTCDVDVKVNGAAVTNSTTVPVKKEKIKVVCLGDSITLGTGAKDPVTGSDNRTEYAYPAQLQKILDANHEGDYEVINYGRGGSLGANVSTYGYESLWNYSLALKENPDIVILAFGANDAVKNTHGRVAVDNFKEEMLEMIAEIQALPTKPIIYMTTTTNVLDGDERPQDLLTELRQIQRETVAEAGIHLLDAHTYSLEWLEEAAQLDEAVANGKTGAQMIYNRAGGDTVHFNALGYEMMARDYYGKGIDWTEQGAHQPDSVSITFSQIETAEINGTTYPTLMAALSAAQTGETVKLIKTAAEDYITVAPTVTLDLNGNTLTTDYVVGFKGSTIFDADTENKGRLVVEKDSVLLDRNNGRNLPIYDAENGCYFFTTVNTTRTMFASSNSKYQFSPIFDEMVHEPLLAGMENSATKVIVRVSWSLENNYAATQDFIFDDGFVNKVISSYNTKYANDYRYSFYAIIKRGGTQVNEMVMSAVVVSDTGVEINSDSTTYEVSPAA